MEGIYRTYADTEVRALATWVKCPYCENEWLEPDIDECGKTSVVHCDEHDDGCGKDFKVYFDAS